MSYGKTETELKLERQIEAMHKHINTELREKGKELQMWMDKQSIAKDDSNARNIQELNGQIRVLKRIKKTLLEPMSNNK